MNDYLYHFERHPSPKGTCPKCHNENAFRYYEGLSREFGRCEKVNICGYHLKPSATSVFQLEPVPSKPEPIIIYPDSRDCLLIINDRTSNLHRFCEKNLPTSITEEHLRKWNVGSKICHQDINITLTVYIYRNKEQQDVNMKFMEYNESGKRNKDRKPYSLKNNYAKNTKYTSCLYGEHLLSDNRNICLVESEKTAVIASFFYPQFDWLATGSSNGLSAMKIKVLADKIVFYICDADKAGRQNSTIDNLRKYGINHTIIDLFPERNDGYDLADAIAENQLPEISPSMAVNHDTNTLPVNTNGEHQKTEEGHQGEAQDVPKGSPVKKVPAFTQVETYLNNLYDFRFNIISAEVEYRKKCAKDYEILNENNIYRELQNQGYRFSINNLLTLFKSDFVHSYNPFKEYFESVPSWKEGDKDYISELASYVKAKNQQRFNNQFKKMLVRSVACSLVDTIFNKQCFVLVGEKQNSGKSTFCRSLCPPKLQDYLSETFTTDKDSLIALSENFIINLDELSTLGRAEINALKSLFSKDKIKARWPYDKKTRVVPRRANFVGSTNKDEFLTDETGSVRWLCFEIDSIDWDYQKIIDYDLVWSQAFALFLKNFEYKLTEADIVENETENVKFQVVTTEEEYIQRYYEPATKDKHDAFYTSTDFIENIKSRNAPQDIRLNPVSFGKALKKLGFKKEQMVRGRYQIKGYYINYFSP